MDVLLWWYTFAAVVILLNSVVVFSSTCNHGDITLVGGTNSEGIIEICFNGLRGWICEYNWDFANARVVCRQLNLPYTGAVPYKSSETLHRSGQSSQSVVLQDVDCVGNEARLVNCNTGTLQGNCYFNTVAGVRCQSATEPCTTGDIQLVGGNSPNEGRIEVCYNNYWGYVCATGWKHPADSDVACRQLGFSDQGAIAVYNSRTVFGKGDGIFVLGIVSCTGSEQRIWDCDKNSLGDVNRLICDAADSFSQLGLRCQILPNAPPVHDSVTEDPVRQHITTTPPSMSTRKTTQLGPETTTDLRTVTRNLTLPLATHTQVTADIVTDSNVIITSKSDPQTAATTGSGSEGIQADNSGATVLIVTLSMTVVALIGIAITVIVILMVLRKHKIKRRGNSMESNNYVRLEQGYPESDISISKLTLLKYTNKEKKPCNLQIIREVMNKWREIGNILGVPSSVLESIPKENHYNTFDCCHQVFVWWLNNDSHDAQHQKTWDGIIELLKDIGFGELANKLDNALICKHTNAARLEVHAHYD